MGVQGEGSDTTTGACRVGEGQRWPEAAATTMEGIGVAPVVVPAAAAASRRGRDASAGKNHAALARSATGEVAVDNHVEGRRLRRRALRWPSMQCVQVGKTWEMRGLLGPALLDGHTGARR